MCSVVIIILGMHGWVTAIRLSPVPTTVYHRHVPVLAVRFRLIQLPIQIAASCFTKPKTNCFMQHRCGGISFHLSTAIESRKAFIVSRSAAAIGRYTHTQVNQVWTTAAISKFVMRRISHGISILHLHATWWWWYNMFNFRPTIGPPPEYDTYTEKSTSIGNSFELRCNAIIICHRWIRGCRCRLRRRT